MPGDDNPSASGKENQYKKARFLRGMNTVRGCTNTMYSRKGNVLKNTREALTGVRAKKKAKNKLYRCPVRVRNRITPTQSARWQILFGAPERGTTGNNR